MKSKPLAMLLSDLGVTKTHSRPQVSNDNPYSESQFKTLKYRPEFPKRFGIQHAVTFVNLFGWYNTEHYTPASVYLHLSRCTTAGRHRTGAVGAAFCESPTLSGVDQSAATKTTHQIGAQAVSEASDDLQVPLICNIYGEVSNSG